MGVPVSRQDIIDDFNIVHDNKYIYPVKEFETMRTLIDIICPIHGIFQQIPKSHIKGHGCSKCGIETTRIKLSGIQKEYIDKVSKLHNYYYNYDKVNYVNRHKKIIVTCPKHRDFEISPNHHLYGKGCRTCYYEKLSLLFRDTKEFFVEKANKIHKNKYLYPGDYKNNMTDIKISCPTHGDFYQTPGNHLAGKGCKRCKESIGEKVINDFLKEHDIPFKREYVLKGYLYRYDFFLPRYNTLIEFHGQQHFKEEKHWGGKKALKKSIRRDLIKVELAKRHGYNIVVIPYYHKNNIEDILKNIIISKNYKIKDISNEIIIFNKLFKNNDAPKFFHLLTGYCNNDDKVFNLYYKHKPKMLVKVKEFFNSVFFKIKNRYINNTVINNKIYIRI